MSDEKNIARDICYFVILGLFGGIIHFLGFTHPELTNTQLFLRFWPVYAGCTAGVILLAKGYFNE